ncbi:hypothetical protein BDC45DRAFT_519472 [Circinella umbellata]|nr:hypothetical protein BDC45DRAFT_519472 [Circinella umbellata]
MESENPTDQIDSSWLKQQPQVVKRQSFLASSHNNNNNSNSCFSSSSSSSMTTMQEQNIISPTTANNSWNNCHRRSSIAPSPTLSTSSLSSVSDPSLILPKKASSIGLNGQFLSPLDIESLLIQPNDDEDEEDYHNNNNNNSNSNSNGDQQRIHLLENELVRAKHESQTYKEQLEHHDQTAQRILEASLAEREKQHIEIRQLVDIIGKQERLIYLLQQKTASPLPLPSSSNNNTAAQHSLLLTSPLSPPLALQQQEKQLHTNAEFETMRSHMLEMRKELNTLISEKRSIESRMAAFLEDELDDMTISHEDLGTFGYHNNSSDQQNHEEILHHLEMRRRSSSLLDADQYSLMAFGTTSPTSGSSHNIHNIQVSATNSSGLLPPLNQVEEEDDDEDDDNDDDVSRYSSFTSSPMTTSTSFNSHSISSPTSLAHNCNNNNNHHRQSTFISMSTSNSTTSPTTAANNNAARKAAWSRVMIPVGEHGMQLPPATPPPSHPLPPVPPINALQAAGILKDDEQQQRHQDYTPPSPATTTTSQSTRSFSPSHRMSIHHPLVISTGLNNNTDTNNNDNINNNNEKHISADAVAQHRQPVRSISPQLPSAPPTTSPQHSSLLAALNKNQSVDANIERSIATGGIRTSADSEMSERTGGFWKGMKKKWIK